MLLKFSIGLDVSCSKVDACLSTIDTNQTVKVKSSCSISNSKAGFNKLEQWIKKWTSKEHIPISICLESTGVYHEQLAYHLDSLGYRVSIILPNKSKKYLQSLGLKSKNDKIDAKGLAQMGAEQNLAKWTRPADIFIELKSLTRQYESIQQLIISEKNRLHAEQYSAYPNKSVVKQLKNHIHFLEKQKKEIEVAIKETTYKDQTVKSKIENICTVRGLSLLSVSTVIAETNGFELFENYKQVVSYAGYDVVENQSGSHRGKTRISKKGNARIRRILHMPALIAKGSEGTVFKNLYERVYERTGIKMKGVVAVQKKLLLIIYYLWKKNESFVNYPQRSLKDNIQEENQDLTLPAMVNTIGGKKNSQTKSLATQGKQPVSNHYLLPLSKDKSTKLLAKY